MKGEWRVNLLDGVDYPYAQFQRSTQLRRFSPAGMPHQSPSPWAPWGGRWPWDRTDMTQRLHISLMLLRQSLQNKAGKPVVTTCRAQATAGSRD